MATPEGSGRPEHPEPLALRSPEQFKALGHPLRHRLVNLLRQRPATLRQLGEALGLPKGTVAYHLGVLQDADMVRVVETRRVRGGTEQYLGLVHDEFTFEDAALGAEFLYRSALAESLPDRPEGPEKTSLRHLWLTAAQARALLARLDRAARDPADRAARDPADRADPIDTDTRTDPADPTDPTDPDERPRAAPAAGAEAYGLLISLYRADIPLLAPDPLLPPDEKA